MSVNKYHGWTLTEIKGPLKFLPTEFDGDLADEFVQVKVSHCGLCYSDLAMAENEWGMTRCPIVLGHEVVGHVSAVGKKVTTLKVGDRVGCSNYASVCLQCEFCASGRDNLCGKATWTVMRGGFGEYVRLHQEFVFVLPASLPNEYAAPLMCAGATVFGPFRVNNVRPTQRVGIVGIGGLGHLALQIARAWGTEVTALSTSIDKEAEAKKFGAHRFVATADKDAMVKANKQYFDFILVTVPAALDWGAYLSMLKSGGTLCIVGVTAAEMVIKPSADMVIRELKVVGGASSSRAGYREMIDFCALHNIRPQIELMPFDRVNEAMELVRKNKPRYRIVLTHPSK